MSYEHDKALKEAAGNAAWQAWIDACPARNTSLAEALFKAGFDRGWDHKEEEANTDRLRAYNLIKAKDAEIAQLKREVTHWQANHANEVKRSRLLKERPDMPTERVEAYGVWGRDLDTIAALQRRVNMMWDALLDCEDQMGLKDGCCNCSSFPDGHVESCKLHSALTLGDTSDSLPKYHDTTPHLHVGDSAFEGWYAQNHLGFNPQQVKQTARDAYAAGMGDPLAMPANSKPDNQPIFGAYTAENDREGYIDINFAAAMYQHDLKPSK